MLQFGSGADFSIYDKPNIDETTYAMPMRSYKIPAFPNGESELTGGEKHFMCSEIEVY
jgi:hypothetical protein